MIKLPTISDTFEYKQRQKMSGEITRRSGSRRISLLALTALGIIAVVATRFAKKQDEVANVNLFAQNGSPDEFDRSLRGRPVPVFDEDGEPPVKTPPAGDYAELEQLLSDRGCLGATNSEDHCDYGRYPFTPVSFFGRNVTSIDYCCDPQKLDLARIAESCVQPRNGTAPCPFDVGISLQVEDGVWCCSPSIEPDDDKPEHCVRQTFQAGIDSLFVSVLLS